MNRENKGVEITKQNGNSGVDAQPHVSDGKRIRELEVRSIEVIQSEEERKKIEEN